MNKFIRRSAYLALLPCAASHAAVLVATNFQGVTSSGATIGNIAWTTDYSSAFGANTNVSTTLATPTAGTISGTNFTNGVNAGASGPGFIATDVNITTAGGVGNTAWTSDYTLAYDLGSPGGTFTLSDASLTVFSRNSTGGIQSATPRSFQYQISILNATGTTTLATDTETFVIPAGTTAGSSIPFNLSNTLLSAPLLGGRTGTLIARVTVQQPNSSTSAGAFTGYTALSLNGTFSAVPEPTTYGLLGAGALAATALVRRRKRA